MQSLGVYLHIPFCRSKCRYCDFASFASKEGLIPSYAAALIKEIELRANVFSDYVVDTVFFGGGTPTLAGADIVDEILGSLARHFRIAPQAEITVEGNPATVEQQEPVLLKRSGVNRFSLGVQSFNEKLLQVLGRIHNSDDVLRTYDNLRAAGFDNINLDLIYGVPYQTAAIWLADLQKAISLRPEHLSLYGLQVEEGTPLQQDVAQGLLREPDEDVTAEMYLAADAVATKAGYYHYEISNFALPGRECRHNLKYWRYQPYIGLGCAAHSFVEGIRTANTSSLLDYLQRMAKGESAVIEREHIYGQEELGEYLMLAFRTSRGVNEREFYERFGRELNLMLPNVENFLREGLLIREDGAIRMTPQAWQVSNYILAQILPDWQTTGYS